MQNSSRHRLNGLLRNKRKMAFAVNNGKPSFFSIVYILILLYNTNTNTLYETSLSNYRQNEY